MERLEALVEHLGVEGGPAADVDALKQSVELERVLEALDEVQDRPAG